MEIKSYDTLLTEICDNFDTYISPKKMKRINKNVVFLIFKAFAKGLEVINNVVVVLSNKFDPANCDEEDLVSVAKITGTEVRAGSSSGLEIIVTNSSEDSLILEAGTYVYALTDDYLFEFTLDVALTFTGLEAQSFIAMSVLQDSIAVTAQDSIAVTREDEEEIDSSFLFSCTNNKELLGSAQETSPEFRERIIQGKSVNTLISLMREDILQLPYIFDCKLFFNNTDDNVTIGEIVVQPWHLLVCISGDPDSTVAKIIASYGIFPTVESDTSLIYSSDAFIDGYYTIYYNNFNLYKYDITVQYKFDSSIISKVTVENSFSAALAKYKVINTYTDLLKGSTFENTLDNLNLSSVEILDVVIYDRQTGQTETFVEVPLTYIARLNNTTFTTKEIDDSATKGIVIPLYMYPCSVEGSGDVDNSSWLQLISLAKSSTVPVKVIIYPDYYKDYEGSQGGGREIVNDDLITDFTAGIAALLEADIEIYGYTYTKYTAWSLSDVETIVDNWNTYYSGITGIFLDGFWNQITPASGQWFGDTVEDPLTYYTRLATYIRNLDLEIMANPGTYYLHSDYVTANASDIWMVWENLDYPTKEVMTVGGGGDYYDPSDLALSKQARLVHSQNYDSDKFALMEQYTGWLYTTNYKWFGGSTKVGIRKCDNSSTTVFDFSTVETSFALAFGIDISTTLWGIEDTKQYTNNSTTEYIFTDGYEFAVNNLAFNFNLNGDYAGGYVISLSTDCDTIQAIVDYINTQILAAVGVSTEIEAYIIPWTDPWPEGLSSDIETEFEVLEDA